MLLAPTLSSVLLGIWDTSVSALQQGHLSGLLKLSLLTTMLQSFPILFVRWLPHGRDDLLALADKPHSFSRLGGIVFLAIVLGSMMWTMVVTLLNILSPHWAGAS
jgi:hypothetical protein